MLSMTGYGSCRVCRDGREMTIELKAVNHRFLDLSFRMPKHLSFLEDELRKRLNQSGIKRGHVDLFVTYQNTRDDSMRITIDETKLEAFDKAVKSVGKQLRHFSMELGKLHIGEVLTLSGALSVEQTQEDSDTVTELAAEAFDGALEKLMDMRTHEGQHLAADLLDHLHSLSDIRVKIAQRAPLVPAEYRDRLTARLQEWKVDAVDPQRIAQEVAMMADKCAIDEELSRLEGHIAQFTNSVEHETEVGRKLDFLIQEMNREVNTIGSKASDAEIASHVVNAKCIIEKLREQVQNAV